mmetsp:Transcript_12780/g.19699  ORF Transcript_12780/g.19699 Transcript_12780/m.19699 type:complete len:234 (-) Transcript_12780:678-1379(-)
MASSVHSTSPTGDSNKESSFSKDVALSDSIAEGVSKSSMATVASSSLSLISSTLPSDKSITESFPSLSAVEEEEDLASSTSATISSVFGVFLGSMVGSLPLSNGALFSTEAFLSFSFFSLAGALLVVTRFLRPALMLRDTNANASIGESSISSKLMMSTDFVAAFALFFAAGFFGICLGLDLGLGFVLVLLFLVVLTLSAVAFAASSPRVLSTLASAKDVSTPSSDCLSSFFF